MVLYGVGGDVELALQLHKAVYIEHAADNGVVVVAVCELDVAQLKVEVLLLELALALGQRTGHYLLV